jgi:hypothetical protein
MRTDREKREQSVKDTAQAPTLVIRVRQKRLSRGNVATRMRRQVC